MAQQYWFTPYSIPPANAPPELLSWFAAIDKNKTGQIRPEELREALSALYTGTGNTGEISLQTAKRLLHVFDADRNGIIMFHEFSAMHNFIIKMRQAFVQADLDRSNSLSYLEIANALRTQGFELSNETANVLLTRFDNDKDGALNWEEFVDCSAYVASLRTVFEWYYNQNQTSKIASKKTPKNNKPRTINLGFDQFLGLDAVFHQLSYSQVKPLTGSTPAPTPAPAPAPVAAPVPTPAPAPAPAPAQ